jgi:hypothetical protein
LTKFGFAFKNLPDSVLEDPNAIKGMKYCFKSLYSVPVIFVEVSRKFGCEGRLNAIAQVMAVCKGHVSP